MIERLRFILLAQLPDASVTGGRTLLAMVRQGAVEPEAGECFQRPFAEQLLLTLTAGIAAERRQELGLLLSLGRHLSS